MAEIVILKTWADTLNAIEEAYKGLSEEQKDVFLTRLAQGEDYMEILADLLGTTEEEDTEP